MRPVSLESLLAFGFFLGLRHAMEADHLAAISTIVTERRSLLSSSLVGAFWGLGHTLALLIAGVGVLLLRFQVTDRMAHGFELCVGIMLVLLGANVLRTVLRRRGGSHVHAHTAVAPHAHADGWLMSRPLLVGLLHGLAGSAPLLLLTLTVISSPLAAFSYIAVFGAGSMMGMTVMSVLVGVPARLTVQLARTNRAVRGLAGVFSVGLGLFIVYENAVLSLLVA